MTDVSTLAPSNISAEEKTLYQIDIRYKVFCKLLDEFEEDSLIYVR